MCGCGCGWVGAWFLQDTMDTYQNLVTLRTSWETIEKQQHEIVKTSLQQLGNQVRKTPLHELSDMHTVCQPIYGTVTL